MHWLRSRLLLMIIVILILISIAPLAGLGIVVLDSYRERGYATVDESTRLLDEQTLNNMEARASTVALELASFLRSRDEDLRVLATLPRTEETYLAFARTHTRQIWTPDPDSRLDTRLNLALYRELAFIDTTGQEQVKIENICFPPYPFDCELEISRDLRPVQDPANTIYLTEDYFARAEELAEGEIYVARPIGWYVPLNEAYTGAENPVGARYQGVVRFIMPVEEDGERVGYVVLALDHTHILEFTAHLDTSGRSPVPVVDPDLDNFAYMVGSNGATIAHIRHSSISGVDRGGVPVPFLQDGDDPQAGPGNFFSMGYLSPVFPELMQRSLIFSRGVVARYEIGESAKSLAYATVPYFTGPNYAQEPGFGLVIVTADFSAQRVGTDVFATQVEDDLDKLTAQIGQLIGGAVILVVIVAVLAALVIIVPIRSVTRYSTIMEERSLTSEEIAGLRERRSLTEVGQLARAFGDMAQQVQQRETQIAELLSLTDEALTQRVKELAALEDVGRRLTATFDVESMLELATETLIQRTNAQSVRLVIEREGNEIPFSIQRGASDFALTTSEAISVPIEAEGKHLGSFTLSTHGQSLGHAQQSFAQQLADWVSVAVTNARLYQSVQQQHTRLEAQNEEIREANRLKSEFLATVSHELRTPLNAIIGFSDMMLIGISGEVSDKQRHQIQRIRQNGKRLLALVNDILDLARIEAGRIDLVSDPFSTREFFSRIQDQYSTLSQNAGLDFKMTLADDVPNMLIGDEQRLSQIVTNLLSNAVKFTEQGSVTLEVDALPSAKHWTMTVRDTGIGIPPHALDYIFEEFRQVDGSPKRPRGGTGLGLAITKNLVRLMDGRITVESTLQQGSTFMVMLPMFDEEGNP